jgi:REP element-mobilizing transposase RayT
LEKLENTNKYNKTKSTNYLIVVLPMEKLQPNSSYHIFNHGNGFENIFEEDENYRFFLERYERYILPIAETYAYCLLPNHFHIVVRIRRREVLEELYLEANFSNPTNSSKVPNFGRVAERTSTDEELERFISKQFANFFSSYTQAFNKVNKRRGSLFIKNFKRQPIDSKAYFESAIAYTHRNPVHHGFCNQLEDWSYSSYCEIKENKSQLVETAKLLKMYGGVDSFIESHQLAVKKYREQQMGDI